MEYLCRLTRKLVLLWFPRQNTFGIFKLDQLRFFLHYTTDTLS